MNIYESGENYLETILVLTNQNGYVRSIDVANELNFTKPSVSRAMGILKEAGYIEVEKNGYIKLTEQGLKKASEIYERHNVIAKFLVKTLNVSEEAALIDACRIEHIISQQIFDKMKEYI